MEPEPPELIETRWSLIKRLKDWDDQESWREFFNTYWKLIYGVALKSGLSPQDGEDIVQETVLHVCKHIKEFKADAAYGSFKSWLLNLTKWRIRDRLRKQIRETGMRSPVSDETSATPLLNRVPDPNGFNLEAAWEEAWQKNLLEAAIQNVRSKASAEQFQIFDFCVLKEWPVNKVAGTLSVSANQVYLARHRISKLIEKEVKRLARESEQPR